MQTTEQERTFTVSEYDKELLPRIYKEPSKSTRHESSQEDGQKVRMAISQNHIPE